MAEPKIAIYPPPAKGFPYVVVTVRESDCEVAWAKTHKQAREIVISKRFASGGKKTATKA